jgi:hypothetical protein
MNTDPETTDMSSNTSNESQPLNAASPLSEESPHWQEFFKAVQASIGRTPRTEVANTSWEAWEKFQASKKSAANEAENDKGKS